MRAVALVERQAQERGGLLVERAVDERAGRPANAELRERRRPRAQAVLHRERRARRPLVAVCTRRVATAEQTTCDRYNRPPPVSFVRGSLNPVSLTPASAIRSDPSAGPIRFPRDSLLRCVIEGAEDRAAITGTPRVRMEAA